MSIAFDEPMDERTRKIMEEEFGERIAFTDAQTALIDEFNFEQGLLKGGAKGGSMSDLQAIDRLERAAKQSIDVQIHNLGETKEMSDGTVYKVTESGWKKV